MIKDNLGRRIVCVRCKDNTCSWCLHCPEAGHCSSECSHIVADL